MGDAMLRKHGAFHFWEFFGDSDIPLALDLGRKGNPCEFTSSSPPFVS